MVASVSTDPVSRRRFLALSGGGVAGLVIAACSPKTVPIDSIATTLPASSTIPVTGGPVDVEIAMRAIADTVEIKPGVQTDVWRLVAEVTRGDAGIVEPIPGSYLGPTLRLRQGQRVRIVFDNEIPQETIVHWHGLDVPEDMDGHPRFAVAEGGRYEYEFTVVNRAGTYWYHPHPHGLTGPQVYAGMAGLLLVGDDEEDAVSLPGGEFELPMVLQDRTFDGDRLVYLPNGMMDQMMGFLGDEILVNGSPDAAFSVAARSYRLRILNGSNARIYKLGWDDGTPLVVVATDGGLLESPVTRPYVTLGPAERVDLWVDFEPDAIGTTRRLVSLPFESDQMMDSNALIPNGSAFDLASFDVDRAASSTDSLPERLSDPGFSSIDDAVNPTAARTIVLSFARGTWMLNGRTFQMTEVSPEETVQFGSTEVWEFFNAGGMGGGGRGGGMGGMSEGLAHPMHMHGQQFQVLERTIDDAGRGAWESVREGYVDEGWKDTVLVMPGERVRILRRFTGFPGLFLYHCHILEHEDMGMMRNFRIATT